jgi:hypothetical protein
MKIPTFKIWLPFPFPHFLNNQTDPNRISQNKKIKHIEAQTKSQKTIKKKKQCIPWSWIIRPTKGQLIHVPLPNLNHPNSIQNHGHPNHRYQWVHQLQYRLYTAPHYSSHFLPKPNSPKTIIMPKKKKSMKRRIEKENLQETLYGL